MGSTAKRKASLTLNADGPCRAKELEIKVSAVAAATLKGAVVRDRHEHYGHSVTEIMSSPGELPRGPNAAPVFA